MLKEFREFAVKGNMFDMAVGIIIGAAFGTIVNSLVNNIIMPIVSGIFRIPDFSNLFVILRNPSGATFTGLEAAREAGAAAFAYGQFINDVLSFLIVAWVLFMLVKSYNTLRKQAEKEQEAAPEEDPADVKLLTEIRDLLAKN